ncbi:hypothetical protein OSB04_030197 [Centaurea solstitialis]|uniref:Uncharacterized protein n=1 Tax=Centaurea solstitialis TaxID=347529 RepID=A0AA38S6E9_9ASTR|nr:hypothetical protein OSB04_030197 [Centaurea solstitialis]
MVELRDNLISLKSLFVKGYQWRGDLISKILQLDTQVKYLCVDVFRIEHLQEVVPFPEIEFVDFFKSHPKLKSLNISGGMIDALCNNHMTSIKNVVTSFKS